jgi:hypothetical protein
MKTNQPIGLIALIAMMSSPAWAGGKSLVIEDAVATVEKKEPLGATISTGYMTHYVFYGVDFGEHAIWKGLDYTVQTPIPIDIGVWYVNPTDGNLDDELDLFASVTQEVGGFEASLAISGYFYPESGDDSSYELGLTIERSLEVVDWNATAKYDFVIGGWYFETGLSKGIALCDCAELVFSGGVAYQHGYNAAASEWNHAYAMLAVPVSIRENVVVEPYVAGLLALDAVEDFQDDLVHAGISLNVSF